MNRTRYSVVAKIVKTNVISCITTTILVWFSHFNLHAWSIQINRSLFFGNSFHLFIDHERSWKIKNNQIWSISVKNDQKRSRTIKNDQERSKNCQRTINIDHERSRKVKKKTKRSITIKNDQKIKLWISEVV